MCKRKKNGMIRVSFFKNNAVREKNILENKIKEKYFLKRNYKVSPLLFSSSSNFKRGLKKRRRKEFFH